MEKLKGRWAKYRPYVLGTVLIMVLAVLVVNAAQTRSTPKPVQDPGPAVVEKEVVVTKEVAVKVEKEVLITATPVPATPTPIPPTSVLPTSTLPPIQVTEAQWEKICVEMVMYARDCTENLNCKRSNDPQRCILYSKEVVETYIYAGRGVHLFNARSLVDQWASEYADNTGKNRDWVINVVGKVMTDPKAMNREIDLQEAWEYWKTH